MNIDSSNRLSKLQFPALLLPLIRKPLFFLSILIVGLIVGVGLLSDFPDLPRLVLSKPPIAEQAYVPAQVTTDAGVWTVVGQVSKDRLLTDLRRLTGVEQVCLDHGCYTITNRTTGSVGLQWAQDYVYQQLTDLGFTVQVQDWTLNGYQDQNLIVRYPGQVTPEDEIYFVAHMDGVNSPAADDNASGTVDLLELARVISHRKYEKTIVLLFSSGEENGTLGVKYYLDHLTPSQLAAIKYVINVDMVGYDKNKDGIMELFNGDQPLDFVQLLAGIILDYHINLTPQIVSDCGWGDEGPFRAKGIIAAVQIQDYNGEKNPYVHTPQDTLSHINLDYLYNQARATAAFAGELSTPIPLNNKTTLPVIIFKDY